MFPVTMFATVTAPVHSIHQWLRMVVWIWFHLLQANVSNQNFSAEEDAINKSWRPLPSRRISERQAQILKWCLLAFNLALSAPHGPNVVAASALLSVVEILHDDFSWSHHPVLKNLCNVGGYLTFESGATLILCADKKLDGTAIRALVLSALLIFTTIHAQDFADCDGDRKSGRRTLPLIAPEGSRIYIFFALVLWSMGLANAWKLGPVCSVLFLAMGTVVGARYYRRRLTHEDESSYRLYNVWLLSAHFLPANARLPMLAW